MDKNNFSTFLRNNINDRFWDNYIELVRNEMIPYQLMALNDEIDGAPKSYCYIPVEQIIVIIDLPHDKSVLGRILYEQI